MDQYQDKELLDLLRNGHSRRYGFSLLVSRYQKPVYWHLRRILISHDDTDDALQNTFLKIWENLDRFREDSKLFTWIYRIATNEALTLLRKRRTRLFLPLVDVESRLAESIADDNYFTGNEVQRKLQQAILKLPQKQRLVFNMKYFGGHTYEEMSEILGTSVGALKASYHLAVKKTEKFLKEN